MDDRVWTSLLLLISVFSSSGQTLPDGAVARIATAPGEPAFTGHIWTSLSPDGRTVAVADEAGRLDLWDLDGKRVTTLRTSGPGQSNPCWSPDGRRLFTSHPDGIAIWDLAKPVEPRVLPSGLKVTDNMSIAVSPDGKFVVATWSNPMTVCWDADTGRERWRRHFNGPLRISKDSRHVVRSEFGQRFNFFEAATGHEVSSLGPPLFMCRPTSNDSFVFSPDGRLLAVSFDGYVSVREAKTGAEAWCYWSRRDPISLLVFSPDGHWLAACVAGSTLLIWDAVMGEIVSERDSPGVVLTSIDFTPDGRRVLTASSDGTAVLRDLAPVGLKPADSWRALSEDGPTAYAGLWSLARDQNGPATLRAKLPPIPRLGERDLARLIDNLDSPRHAVRERASRALNDQGRAAIQALQTALTRTNSAESAARLEKLIPAADRGFTSQEITHRRAVKAMSLAGTAEARELLAEWAAGAPGAVLTDEAKAALGRR